MVKYTKDSYTPQQYKKDLELVEAVNDNFLDFNDPERHIDDKMKIIGEVMGYKWLRIGSNRSEVRFLPLGKCRAERINAVLRGAYTAAHNRVSQLGNPAQKTKKDISDKTINVKIDQKGQYQLF